MTSKACEGGSTHYVRTTEHMQECRYCDLRVREDLVEHSFFGFAAACPFREKNKSGPTSTTEPTK